MNTTSQPSDDATRSCAPVAGSAQFLVHDAMGNWMIEDRALKRMICMSTRERDAQFIAEQLNLFATTWTPPQKGSWQTLAEEGKE